MATRALAVATRGRRSPAPLSPAADVRVQSGVLAYRVDSGGRHTVLLISKRRSNGWGIPKGHLAPMLSLAQNAAKEAFEEAGIEGRIAKKAAGVLHLHKHSGLHPVVFEVWVHLLEVTRELEEWPERAERRRRWVPPREAAEILREPLLVQLCKSLEAPSRAR